MSAQIANRRLCTALFQTYYVASVEEASPWARRDKTDWSSEVRSSRVPRVGGAPEWRMGQWLQHDQKRKKVNIFTRQSIGGSV